MGSPETAETFQITLEGAEAYESLFVPALFAEWAPILVDFAGVESGMSVLDVACGTGIVTRTASDRVGSTGKVTGLDLNEAMLTVARRVRSDIEWRQGDAADLPFPDASFDIVTCQMALMFFPDPREALKEMGRVAKGTVAIVVPSALEAQPVWGPFVEAAARHAGPEAVSLLSTYWSCGDLDALRGLFVSAGLDVFAADARFGTATFPSIDAFVTTEVESTPLIDRISDEAYSAIREDTRKVLDPFTTDAGVLEAPIECHLVAARPS
ncbi:MAG: methyltransferase domain-containing protein [Actinomycetota bacterium]